MATIVEGNPKAPFSIATTPRCRGGRYSFPGLLYFTLDPYLIMLSVKQGGIKYHFLSLWYDSTVEDRQSRIAWQTINEVSRRKNTAKAKLKAANQLERIKLWKQHFENLLGNPPKITHEPITRIISKQLDIKVGPFTQEELDSVLRKIKNRKAAGLDEIPPEVWKTRQFDDILLRHCNAVYNQNPIDRWMKGCILPFPKKGDLGLAKNYRGITLTSIASQNLQCPTTKPNRTQNRHHT